jgi:hypothetical protein
MTALTLVVVGIAKSGPYQDAPSPALPLYLGLGGIGAGVVTACAAWAVWIWTDPRATRAAFSRAAVLAIGMTVAVALGEAAIREGKQRLYKMYCERDGVAPHHLVCNPQGARDYATAELHALVCLVAAAAVLGVTMFVMHRIARSAERTLEAAACA